MSLSPPITPEQIAALPPEFRALLQAVIDHYEKRVAGLEAELAAVRAELEATKKIPRCLPAPNTRMPSRRRRRKRAARSAAVSLDIRSTRGR